MSAPAGYPRSTGTERGQARRRELLTRVTDDLAANGLIGFSLRRAARAAGTTHKVLLYHFTDADELLALAVEGLRRDRIERGIAAALAGPDSSLADRVEAMWPVLVGAGSGTLDEAMGLAMHDPARYGRLVQAASGQYLAALWSVCPSAWSDERRREVTGLILATMRGLVLGRRVAARPFDHRPALVALRRALDREEQQVDAK